MFGIGPIEIGILTIIAICWLSATGRLKKWRGQFSLRTLFILLAIAAVVAWWNRPPTMSVVGDIDEDDVVAILHTIQGDPLLNGQFVTEIKSVSPIHADVLTDSREVEVEKTGDKWVVKETRLWIW
jgi:hypothetical protein